MIVSLHPSPCPSFTLDPSEEGRIPQLPPTTRGHAEPSRLLSRGSPRPLVIPALVIPEEDEEDDDCIHSDSPEDSNTGGHDGCAASAGIDGHNHAMPHGHPSILSRSNTAPLQRGRFSRPPQSPARFHSGSSIPLQKENVYSSRPAMGSQLSSTSPRSFYRTASISPRYLDAFSPSWQQEASPFDREASSVVVATARQQFPHWVTQRMPSQVNRFSTRNQAKVKSPLKSLPKSVLKESKGTPRSGVCMNKAVSFCERVLVVEHLP